MKKFVLKTAGLVALLTLSLMMLCSCSGKEAEEVSREVSAQIVIEVDGKKITIEDAEGKTVKQLLEDAKITLHEGDVLSLDENVKISGDVFVKVLRRASVTVKDTVNGEEYSIVMTGGTVKEALNVLGIKLEDNHTVNHDLKTSLENGMEIIVSIKEEPETTEYNEENYDDDSYNDSYDDYYDDSDDDYTPPTPATTKPATTAPATTKAPATTAPATTKPVTQPTTSGRTVVNVEIYEDCDGSGHGVKVITYSDGTQEEVAF